VISPQDTAAIADGLWDVLPKLKGSDAKAKLVASSKILHHLLPELMPPIDREHTAELFMCRNWTQGKGLVKSPVRETLDILPF
jgi:hypothetical protein